MSEPELIDEIEPQRSSNPGKILASEREQLRLSQQDVADQLNLRLDVIDAIESDNYDEIPGGETFVRGYIRAYARLVDIDEEDVLEERNYNVELKAAPRPVIAPLINKTSKPSQRRIRKPSVATKYIFGFAALAAVIIATWSFSDIPSFNIGKWIDSFSESDSVAVSQSAEAVTGDLPVQVNVTRLDTSEFNQQEESQNQSETQSVILEPESDTVAKVVADDNDSNELVAVISNDDSQIAESTAVVEPESTNENSTTSSEQVISLTQDDSTTTQSDSTDEAINETSDAPNTLMLVSEDASWAEVRDASGQRLLYAMLQPRQTRNLNGQEPFDITLGNATSVRIRLDDSAMDISEHIRPGRTAHLRIGAGGVSKTR